MKSGIKKVAVACNTCGADDAEFVTEGSEHEYTDTTDDVFTVVRCRACGLFYLNPRPDVSELKTIYPDSYYAYHLQKQAGTCENRRSPLYQARRFVYLSRLRKALRLCPDTVNPSVLDVGCADGRALNWYKQLPEIAVETYGVDFDEPAVARARQAGHRVFLGRFEEAEIPGEMFDLVVATHVIEHVADPKAFARKAFQVLKPGGIFLCETPNADAADARLFRNRHWGGYHFPRHWVLYTPQSLRRLAAEVGFEVVRLDFHPAPAFWNWTFHSLIGSLGPPGARGAMRHLADRLFPPVAFQENNLRNLLAVSLFTSVDLLIKAATGQTSNMAAVLRRPVYK